jgi:DeoR/GlpR family transcriptional regulator of sugar metabolism
MITKRRKANMTPEQRQQRIAKLIQELGSITVARLEEELGTSSATARRDLAVLERQGKIRRSGVVGFLFMPNTAGRSLEELEAENYGEPRAASATMCRA